MSVPMFQIPSCLSALPEDPPVIHQHKKAMSRGLWLNRAHSVRKYAQLLYWLHLYDQNDSALEGAQFLLAHAGSTFSNPTKRFLLDFFLVLAVRLNRLRGNTVYAEDLLQQLRVSFWAQRTRIVDGTKIQYDLRHVELAVKENDVVGERFSRFEMFMELCFLIEMGGSDAYRSDNWPLARLERMFLATKVRLRVLVDHPKMKLKELNMQHPPPSLE